MFCKLNLPRNSFTLLSEIKVIFISIFYYILTLKMLQYKYCKRKSMISCVMIKIWRVNNMNGGGNIVYLLNFESNKFTIDNFLVFVLRFFAIFSRSKKNCKKLHFKLQSTFKVSTVLKISILFYYKMKTMLLVKNKNIYVIFTRFF